VAGRAVAMVAARWEDERAESMEAELEAATEVDAADATNTDLAAAPLRS
jgi:hypothetical protein